MGAESSAAGVVAPDEGVVIVSDLWPTAVHESSHATVAVLLRATRHAGPVSIVQTEHADGVCFSGRPARPTSADFAASAVWLPLVPARIRRWHEIDAMVNLAGYAGEELHAGLTAPELQAPALLEPLAPEREVALPPREEEMLLAAARDVQKTDLERAWATLVTLHRGDEQAAELAAPFWQHETRRLLQGKRARLMVRTLAEELMVHKTLPSRRWKQILAGIR